MSTMSTFDVLEIRTLQISYEFECVFFYHTQRLLFAGFEPGTFRWEEQMLPLCHTSLQLLSKRDLQNKPKSTDEGRKL